ncbi:MAG: enoyl-CoA hydratase/isomerase family protein [bacterium]
MAQLEFERFFKVRMDSDCGILTLTIDKEGDKYNTFGPDLVGCLKALLESYYENETIRALILTGSGKVFSTGADIRGQFPSLDPHGARHFSYIGQRVFQMFEAAPFITCAAINGFALGGGLEIAMACDFRTASTRARLGLPEINLGVMPGWGGTQRLPRLVGRQKALEMILSGEPVTPQEAKELGLVCRVFEPEELLPGTMKFLAQFTKKSRTAIAVAKRAVVRGLTLSIDDGLDLESELFGLLWASPDREEGVRAFMENRKPEFKK